MFKWKRQKSKPLDMQLAPQPSVRERDNAVLHDLFDTQLRILGGSAVMIIDAGSRRKHTTEQYLSIFPKARVLAIDTTPEGFAQAETRRPSLSGRIEFIRAILADSAGVTEHRQDADAPPSFSADKPPISLPTETIDTVTVDDVCAARGIEFVDVLKVSTRSGTLKALKGAEAMLTRGAIRLVVLKVKFVTLDGEQPTFWYITDHLRRYGYALQGIYEWRHQPQMPAVLLDAEAVFVAPQTQVIPGTALSSPLLDRISETVPGSRLPDRFFSNARLQDGATIRPQSPIAGLAPTTNQLSGAPSGLASITNVIIDTAKEPYRYSVVLDVDSSTTRHLEGNGFAVVELFLNVIGGGVGVVWIDQNSQPFTDTERCVFAAPGLQKVLVSVPLKQAHQLVFRNVAYDLRRATFRIVRVKTKVIGDSLHKRTPDQPDAEALYLRARAIARARDLDTAARMLTDAAALAPDYAEVLEGQGEAFDMLGRTDAAAKYDAARRLRAESRQGMPDRTFALRRRGHSTNEIAAYTAMLESAKDRPFAYIARGNAFLAEGRADRALIDYEAALEIKPTANEIATLKGEALSMLGCHVEALEVFDMVLSAHPHDTETLSGRAIAHLALGKLELADVDWRRQFELLPPARASARACVALRLADYEAALPELELAVEKDPTDPYWQLYRLTALHRLGRPATSAKPPTTPDAGAKNWPNQLLALYTGNTTSKQVLAKADNHGRRAEALFHLGVLTFERNREEARRLWSEVVEQLRPDLIEHAAAQHELGRLGS